MGSYHRLYCPPAPRKRQIDYISQVTQATSTCICRSQCTDVVVPLPRRRFQRRTRLLTLSSLPLPFRVNWLTRFPPRSPASRLPWPVSKLYFSRLFWAAELAHALMDIYAHAQQLTNGDCVRPIKPVTRCIYRQRTRHKVLPESKQVEADASFSLLLPSEYPQQLGIGGPSLLVQNVR